MKISRTISVMLSTSDIRRYGTNWVLEKLHAAGIPVSMWSGNAKYGNLVSTPLPVEDVTMFFWEDTRDENTSECEERARVIREGASGTGD